MTDRYCTEADLSQHHTFGLPVRAQYLVEADSVQALEHCFADPALAALPKLVLGGGSNVLFVEDYQGVVVLNRILGRDVTESTTAYHLHLGAGENWHHAVDWSIEQGMPGLENLALIPGTVGAAPVQNIGAYGVELADVCEYVEYWDIESAQLVRLSAEGCQFGYRDSIFKGELKGRAIVVAVGLKLPKVWDAKLGYGPLRSLADKEGVNAREVFDAVCQIRASKLPDPVVLGNAGSFFKNPVIDAELHAKVKDRFPDMPSFPAGDTQFKVPAGWLIDQAGLKGHRVGGAAVHRDQALVLVNIEDAKPEDVTGLARHVVAQVAETYGIELEPEVRILDKTGTLCW